MGISKTTIAGLVSLLILVHVLLGVSSLAGKSATFDEAIHVTAGYSYWRYNDYCFQPENGNLPQRWAALPLLFSATVFPDAGRNVWETAYAFFYKSDNDADRMLFQARSMILCLSVLLALVVYNWSARLFGPLGGMISLGLYCFSPTILAHGRLTTSDLAAVLFFTLALRTIWDLLHRVTLKTVGAASLAVAGLLLSKMSGVLIVPVGVLMVGVKLWWGHDQGVMLGKSRQIVNRSGQGAVFSLAALMVVFVSLVAIWGAYGFRFSAAPTLPAGQMLSFPQWDQDLQRTGWMAPGIESLRDAKILPEAYLYGFTNTLSRAQARYAFLCGNYSSTGWWYFFPFCMAVKTPLTTLMVVALGIGALVRARRRDLWYAVAPMLCFAAVYGAAALTANINIGHRHVLPLYPVLFIIAGATALWFRTEKRSFAFLSSLLAVAFLLETLLIWPHYLAFFNVAAGGPENGYRLLVDSSLDWGQDLPGLARWIQARGIQEKNRRSFYLAYFGMASPAYYRIPARIFVNPGELWASDVTVPADALGPGYYCISATILQQVYGIHGNWDRNREAAYWLARGVVRQYVAAQQDPIKYRALMDQWHSEGKVVSIIRRFYELRLARLCHYLKKRAPDAHVGYSILIYKVSPEELKTALFAPLAQ
ncbi:MAG: hypothetical protein JEZ11_13065 [Desulfobacterales bacterium]|nr:hypothetical protein [Desulfobacterales bacterium]